MGWQYSDGSKDMVTTAMDGLDAIGKGQAAKAAAEDARLEAELHAIGADAFYTLVNYGHESFNMGDYEGAIEDYKNALKVYKRPVGNFVYAYIAMAYAKLKDEKNAVKYFYEAYKDKLWNDSDEYGDLLENANKYFADLGLKTPPEQFPKSKKWLPRIIGIIIGLVMFGINPLVGIISAILLFSLLPKITEKLTIAWIVARRKSGKIDKDAPVSAELLAYKKEAQIRRKKVNFGGNILRQPYRSITLFFDFIMLFLPFIVKFFPNIGSGRDGMAIKVVMSLLFFFVPILIMRFIPNKSLPKRSFLITLVYFIVIIVLAAIGGRNGTYM
jgi:tetratricopeptide (TPR) repeat protein